MIASARRSRSWRSGSATEVWCRTCSCFIGLLPPLILLEEPENGETGLAPHVPLQLLHLRLDYQVNRFMGCDCHIELIFKSWKSYLHLATLTTKKAETTLCYLYGRMLLILLNYALCPQLRATLWRKKKRELSVLKLVRHFQALAERWMQAIFQSEFELRRFLHRACATAERLVAKAVRKRRTTAQLLRQSLYTQKEPCEFAVAVNA
jgi:hypothetical protein